MSFLSTYSPRNVVVNYAGALLNSGRTEDVFVNITQGAERAAFRKGNSGDTAISLSPDHSAIVTLSFYPESQPAKVLTGLYHAMEKAESKGEPVSGVAPLVIVDPSGSVFLTCNEAVLRSKSDVSLGSDTGTVSFEFYVEEVTQGALPDEYADDVSAALNDLGISV